jgi:hypothetical protein
MNNLLTQAELEALTGAKQAERQKRVLDDNGIYYIQRLDKTIVTTWHHVNHPTGIKSHNDDMPDFSKVS